VRAGEPAVELHADDPGRFAAALEALTGALTVSGEPPALPPLIVTQIGA
jgi:thymidine phosphorylase